MFNHAGTFIRFKCLWQWRARRSCTGNACTRRERKGFCWKRKTCRCHHQLLTSPAHRRPQPLRVGARICILLRQQDRFGKNRNSMAPNKNAYRCNYRIWHRHTCMQNKADVDRWQSHHCHHALRPHIKLILSCREIYSGSTWHVAKHGTHCYGPKASQWSERLWCIVVVCSHGLESRNTVITLL